MKYVKLLLIAALVLCMALSLCACTQTPADETQATTDSTTAATDASEETTAPADDGKVTYTVTVVDEEGNPISGAMVQMCKEACIPGKTNENGVAEFSLAEDEYKVSFLALPTGYTYSSDATEFYFEDGAAELTITLKAEG